jgi:hypothetical protein
MLKFSSAPDRMIQRMVGMERTSFQGEPVRRRAPIAWVSLPPRGGSCKNNAATVHANPGSSAT